jgi:hypothetical protein
MRSAALSRARRWEVALGGAMILAAALRFTSLDARGWWRDEAVTVELLRLPFGELLRTIPDSEGSPPLYYVLAWGWTRALGDGEAGLRSLSALLGVVTVLLVFLAARTLVSTRTGVVAAYLAAASPLLVWHDQDGRSYALLTTLSALSFLFFVRLLRVPSTRDAVGFALAASLALLTHYFAVFLIAPLIAWLLARPSTRRIGALAAGAVAVVGCALVPLARAQSGNVDWVAEVPLGDRLVELVQSFLVGPQAPWERGATIVAGLLVLAALALLLARGSAAELRAVLPAAVVGAVALVLPLALAVVGLDYLLARNLIVAWVPLAIVCSTGMVAERARAAGLAVAAALVALGAAVVLQTASTPKFVDEDWRGAAHHLGAPPPGGRAIVLWPGVGVRPFRLYRPGASPIGPQGAEVSEVVVLAFGAKRRDIETYASSLFPSDARFRMRSRIDEPHVTIVRFEAETPVRVTASTLVATEPGAPDTVVLVDS